jgi:NtrC-family two-component system sensor histidine kinase KinB
MKVAKRVTLGYLLLLLAPALLLAIQFFGLRRLKEANQRISGDGLKTLLTVVELIRDRDIIEDVSQRVFAKGDTASREEFKESMQSFDSALRETRSHGDTGRAQEEIGRLDQFWREFNEAWTSQEGALQGNPPDGNVPPDLSGQLDRLRAQSLTVYQAILKDIRSRAADARKSSERTEMIAWWIGCATLVFGVLSLILTVRSVSLPLRSLSQGTRGIAEGKSFYRLDTSGNDELSQIAKDFNTLADRLREKSGSEGRSETRQL